jgi:AAA+ ATPase superfamily predicted ATPase
MPFYNREDELDALERRWAAGKPQFFVVWGRRRVGKTELLNHFLDGKRGFMLEATEGLEPDHLSDLTDILAAETGNSLFTAQPLASWPAALAAIEQYVTEPTVITLDEFQWVARATADIGSQLNRWWRTTGSKLPIFLILSGSEVSFFEKDVLTGAMYGRRTGQQQLSPFNYSAAGLFFPDWSPEDRIRAYAVCGGMPYYLEQFDSSLSLEDNILQAILYRDGVLHEEAKLLLYEELPEPARYFSILRAIANGETRVNEIAQRTKVQGTSLYEALELLKELYLVRRRYPVTIANPDRTKLTYYEITDGYLRFYFRFMHPFESRLKSNAEAERHLRETVMPNLDHFVSKPAFEEVCQEYVRVQEHAAAVGSWWGSVRNGRKTEMRELDIVAIDGQGVGTAVGTCKWTTTPVGMGEENLIARLETAVRKMGPDPRHYFFSLSGFDQALEQLAATDQERYRLVRPKDLY